MIHCSEIVDIEDLGLGTLSPGRARELRAHLAGCAECQREEELVGQERALFVRREALVDPLPAAAALQLAERLRVEAAAAPAAARGRLLRIGARGYALMGGAAACCAMWALVHGAPVATLPGAATRLDDPSAPLASHVPATVPSELACELGDLPATDSTSALACGGGLATREICEEQGQSSDEPVTCSSVRQ